MSGPVIAVENLGKRYTISHRGEGLRYKALRDVLANRTKSAWHRLLGILPNSSFRDSRRALTQTEDFWALRNVNFQVRAGEVVGIIGRNGAGKSTLLKILSRITEPTEGRVRIKGRVASLLEVGTGFHPELTGRENIFLNGAILGMQRAEIKRKFDEIVAFAEVDKFLDTPVKRYSSGMYVRLAFAVAAHLEPEILIVDEVLAVGDAEFQKKCLGKMEDVSKGGRTVLFVSHNMDTISRLCGTAILMKDGVLKLKAGTHEVIPEYLHDGRGTTAFSSWRDSRKKPGNDVVRLIEVKAHDAVGKVKDTFDVREPIGITLCYEILRNDVALVDDLNVFNDQGLMLFVSHNVGTEVYNKPRDIGYYESTAWIAGNLLAEGGCVASLGVVTLSPFTFHVRVDHAISFQVTDPIVGGSARGAYTSILPGVMRPMLKWTTKRTQQTSSTIMEHIHA
jgi:lipopolysaccharide transport system ATP-binding protein